MIIAIVVVMVAGLAGGAGWLLSRKASAEPGKKSGGGAHTQVSSEDRVTAVVHLESFVVNLADTDQSAFLRVGIDLGVGKLPPEAQGDIKNSPLTPKVRDCVLGILSSWRSDALLASDGRDKLKQELLAALRKRVPELDIQEVYFTEFLVQR